MRWGEAVLAALVGYYGDKIASPVGQLLVSKLQANPTTAAWVSAMYGEYQATHSGMSPSGQELGGYILNKLAGLGAIVKPAADVARGKRLSMNDKNILLPYGLGTVFDTGASFDGQSSGAWK